jgi:diguanylate cyclase (GGDEF)-like protein
LADAKSARDFDLALAQAREAHQLLVRIQRDTVGAKDDPANLPESPLLEANEQLVLAALRAQADAETASVALEEASRLAGHDALTDLPNRLLLLDRLASAIASAKRRAARFTLMFLDIDKFKEINDTLGHTAGDQVLQHAARCLVSSIRGADTVSRHGGDEFILLLSEMSRASDVVLVAKKVIAALGAPTQVGDRVLRLTASIGIAIYPDDGDDARTLIDRADAAMYQAKRSGPGEYAFHGDEPSGEASPRLALDPSMTLPDGVLEPARRIAQLREANEKLVLVAIKAQALQVAAEHALRRLTASLVAPKPDPQAPEGQSAK